MAATTIETSPAAAAAAAAAAAGIVRTTTTIISTITAIAAIGGGSATGSTTFATGITETETIDPATPTGTAAGAAAAAAAVTTAAEVARKAFVDFEIFSPEEEEDSKYRLLDKKESKNRRFVHCCELILRSSRGEK